MEAVAEAVGEGAGNAARGCFGIVKVGCLGIIILIGAAISTGILHHFLAQTPSTSPPSSSTASPAITNLAAQQQDASPPSCESAAVSFDKQGKAHECTAKQPPSSGSSFPGSGTQTAADFMQPLSSTARPIWQRLFDGQRVWITGDPTFRDHAVVCNSTSATVRKIEGFAEKRQCTLRPAGIVVMFHHLERAVIPGDQYPTWDALVSTTVGQQWIGYVVWESLQPIAPQGSILRLSNDSSLPTQFRSPEIFKSSSTTSADLAATRHIGPPTWVNVADMTKARVIAFHPLYERQFYIEVLDGTHTGLYGWVASNYLSSEQGYSVAGFFPNDGPPK